MSATLARSRASDRIETLHQMLLYYHEARAEANGMGGGGSRPEARLLGWDRSTYTAEYRELDRCLAYLRSLAGSRSQMTPAIPAALGWWTLKARYLDAETVRREVHHRRTHSGERVPVRLPSNMEVVARATILNGRTSYAMVRVWNPGVNPKVVEAGLRWIAGEFWGRPRVYEEES